MTSFAPKHERRVQSTPRGRRRPVAARTIATPVPFQTTDERRGKAFKALFAGRIEAAVSERKFGDTAHALLSMAVFHLKIERNKHVALDTLKYQSELLFAFGVDPRIYPGETPEFAGVLIRELYNGHPYISNHKTLSIGELTTWLLTAPSDATKQEYARELAVFAHAKTESVPTVTIPMHHDAPESNLRVADVLYIALGRLKYG
jgi:hypothetical protein